MGEIARAFAKSFSRPDEVLSLVRYKLQSSSALKGVSVGALCIRITCANRSGLRFKVNQAQLTTDHPDPAWKYSYRMLVAVSRSFAVVIQQLGDELRDPVCIFYLVLRALDTVEDDTTIPKATRVARLRDFHNHLGEVSWKAGDAGKGKELELLQNFDRVQEVFRKLKPAYQEVIKDITNRMGNGMADFVEKTVDSLEDYNLYCHYVAGLVGIGLSKMFAASGIEDKSYASKDKLSNSMGLFLQKVNIIRDYLEDLLDKRIFWPKEVWAQYAPEIAAFSKKENLSKGLECLNHLITDALRHIPDCFEYLRGLKDPNVFKFCAIPQIMAIATLAAIYNNPNVFTGVVKLRRGLSVKIILDCNDMDAVYRWFAFFLKSLRTETRSAANTTVLPWTVQSIKDAEALIPKSTKPVSWLGTAVFGAALAACSFYMYSRLDTLDPTANIALLPPVLYVSASLIDRYQSRF
eukprot:tig00001107_g7096.t1